MVYKIIYYRLYLRLLIDLHKSYFITDEQADKQVNEQKKYLKKRLIDDFLNIISLNKNAA